MLNLNIRWAIRPDMGRVEEIEQESFKNPWTLDRFLEQLRETGVVCLVAETKTDIVGYTVYELQPERIYVLNLAVDKRYRRQYVAMRMLHRLQDKLNPKNRNRLVAVVSEYNLPAQLTMKKAHMDCVAIDEEPFEGSSVDGYRFVYDIRGPEHDLVLSEDRFRGAL